MWNRPWFMSPETLKSSHLKNVFFLLHIAETSFGNAKAKFQCLWISDKLIWLKIFKYFH